MFPGINYQFLNSYKGENEGLVSWAPKKMVFCSNRRIIVVVPINIKLSGLYLYLPIIYTDTIIFKNHINPDPNLLKIMGLFTYE